MTITRNVKTYLRGELPPLPILTGMASLLENFPQLEEDLDRSILSEEEVSDQASPDLRDIRRSIIRQNENIRSKLNQILASEANKTYLQDTLVTVRDGRFVIPVKQEHKARFPGMVHDQSASGATLFIEPQAVVEMNNELRRLQGAEQAEIDRILAELSARIGEHRDILMNNLTLLTKMDIINAKGKLSAAMKGECPVLGEDDTLVLVDARHPLIDARSVVPINISMGRDFDALVITGPNTGGKTVTLKTVGLLAMMTQTGLHIPASSLSQMPVYSGIFADIGDEQSIEQSLSTFSSHMNNIVGILDKAGPGTLVLLDELGAGTDPTEGAALAIAILERLREGGADLLATTHYTELKKYAIATPGVENASMEFDVATLSPTYRLVVGIPGKSNAFEISAKLGLEPGVIDHARMLLERGDIQFEEILTAIEGDKRAAEAERDEAIRLNIEMKRQKETLDAQQQKWEARREIMMQTAREEARELVTEAKDFSVQVREELREIARMESLGERTSAYDSTNKRIKDAAGRYREKMIREENDAPPRPEDLKPGDRVRVLSLGQNGEALTAPDDRGEVMVQVGRMKVKVRLPELKLINDGSKKTKSTGKKTYGSLYQSKAKDISVSLDLTGDNLDTASDRLDKYLDDAMMAGLSEVTIIHGRGGGILRTGLRDMMKHHRHVEGYRTGKYNEGGDGVTIVRLK